MILTIDIGNTNLVFALFDNAGNIRMFFRLSTNINRKASEYFVHLKIMLEHNGCTLDDIKKISIANVVPDVEYEVYYLCTRYLKVEPFFVNMTNVPIECSIMTHQVGADRIANIISAFRLFPNTHILIVDIGTATTFDLVDKDGKFYGEVIAPGPGKIQEAFSKSAALLPSVSFKKTDKKIANSLIEAMQSGMFWGYKNMIQGLINDIVSETKEDLQIIMTGGYVEVLKNELSIPSCSVLYDKNLTIVGLYYIAIDYIDNIN